MKKLFIILAIGIACVSCSKYDDLYDMVYDLGKRVDYVEQQNAQLKTNMESLEAIINAMEKYDFITGVTPITQGSVILGYTITFAKSDPITIWNGGSGDQSFFRDVTYDDDYVYFILADGTKINVPRKAGGSSNIIAFTMHVNQEDWLYTDVDNNNYFWATFDMPEITEDVFDNGLIKIYRTYDYASNNPVQLELPQVRHAEWYNSSYDEWCFYTETIDYEINIGSVTVFYTASDFDYELDLEFVPEAMEFRCVIIR